MSIHINKISAVILMAIAIFYLTLTFLLPDYEFVPTDSDVIPKILGFTLVILSGFLFFFKEEKTDKNIVSKNDVIILSITVVIILVYIFLLEIVGFIIMTACLVFFLSLLFGYRRHIVNITVSILFPVIMYLIFSELLMVRLPSGILPF